MSTSALSFPSPHSTHIPSISAAAMSSSFSATRVLICSKIPNLKKALESVLPKITFKEIDPTELEGEESTKHWRSQILVADNDFIGQLIYRPTEQFAFVQGTWAGIDPIIPLILDGVSPPQLKLARLAHPGIAQIMSEYLVAHVINSERSFVYLVKCQLEQRWGKQEVHTQGYRVLSELTVGILGVGEIGRVAARLFKAFGCQTLGLVRRNPPPSLCPDIDQYFDFQNLSSMLERCDYICSILPKTTDTNDILGKDSLKACQGKGTTLLNIGRANIISDKDLLKALDQGWLKEAVLDVFHEEPLPSGHPFWTHPKVVITPHLAAISLPRLVAGCFVENLERFEKGEEVANLVDWNLKY